jgi:hypothetical protein
LALNRNFLGGKTALHGKLGEGARGLSTAGSAGAIAADSTFLV